MKNDMEVRDAQDFCRTLSYARHYKLDGWWQGSAYDHHPCGVIRKGIIFCNEWCTFNYCSASVILNPKSKIIPPYNDPLGRGNPHPRPEDGGVLLIYSYGCWSQDDGPWRQIVVDVLSDLDHEIEIAEKIKKSEDEKKIEDFKSRHREAVEKARIAILENQK